MSFTRNSEPVIYEEDGPSYSAEYFRQGTSGSSYTRGTAESERKTNPSITMTAPLFTPCLAVSFEKDEFILTRPIKDYKDDEEDEEADLLREQDPKSVHFEPASETIEIFLCDSVHGCASGDGKNDEEVCLGCGLRKSTLTQKNKFSRSSSTESESTSKFDDKPRFYADEIENNERLLISPSVEEGTLLPSQEDSHVSSSLPMVTKHHHHIFPSTVPNISNTDNVNISTSLPPSILVSSQGTRSDSRAVHFHRSPDTSSSQISVSAKTSTCIAPNNVCINNSESNLSRGKERGTWSKLFTIPLQRSRSTGQNNMVESPSSWTNESGQNNNNNYYPDNLGPSISSASYASGTGNPPYHAAFLSQKPAIPKNKLNRKTASAADASSQYQSDTVYEGDGKSAASERKKKRSLGIDMREKFPILFRRPVEQQVQATARSFQSREMDRLLRIYRPTVEQIERWSSSFDALLADKVGLALFHEFLRSEFSDENIEFWIACEEYRNVTAPKKMAGRAQKIFNDYVAVQAKREVNLDSTTRLHTENQIQNPTTHSFDQSQKRIQALMEKDSYRRFLRSEAFLALRKELQTAQTTSQSNVTLDSPPGSSGPISGALYISRHKTDSSILSKLGDLALSRHESTPVFQGNKASSPTKQDLVVQQRKQKCSVPSPVICIPTKCEITIENRQSSHFPNSDPNIVSTPVAESSKSFSPTASSTSSMPLHASSLSVTGNSPNQVLAVYSGEEVLQEGRRSDSMTTNP